MAANIPKKYFDVVTYTGNGTEQTVLGLQFSPDLVWIKERNGTNWNYVYDAIRGTGRSIYTNETSAEGSTPNGLTSFDSNGFSLGYDTAVNTNNNDYVAWCWNAGDTTKTIAVGELNSETYDQSQEWSSNVTYTGTAAIGVAFLFDGNTTTTGAQIKSDATLTLSGVTGQTVTAWIDNIAVVTVNGQTLTGTTAGYTEVSVDLGSVETISTIEMSGNNGSIAGLAIDGRLLVDTSITPANVPSIETTVRASQEAGFSVVKYTGDGNLGSTFAHGLGKAPSMVIVKDLDRADNWAVYHRAVPTPEGKVLYLNTTGIAVSNTGWWNNTAPTDTVISLGNASTTNTSGEEHIAYCFSDIPAYSSTGSYLGNGSAEGPFINCGFKPQFVLLKSTDGTFDWCINDDQREESDPGNARLSPNLPNAEVSDAANDYRIDFLSNGFQIRGDNTAQNQSGTTYIYYAVSRKSLVKPTLEKVEFEPDVVSTWDRKQYDFAVGDSVEQVGTTIRETGDVLSVTTNSNGSVTLVVTNDVGTFDIGDVLTQNAQTGTIIGLDEETNSIIVIPD